MQWNHVLRLVLHLVLDFWLEVKSLLLWRLQLVVSFLTRLLESELLLQEAILAVCL